MREVYLSDNNGNRVPPGVNSGDPVLATGQTLSLTADDTDYEATVVAGESYLFTAAVTGPFVFGIADVTTAANIVWVCPLAATIHIKIPVGYTVLHYAGPVINAKGYLRKLSK